MRGRAWTAAEVETVRGLYADTVTKEIAAKIGRSLSEVYRRAKAEGLAKSAAFLASPESGILRKGQMRPGSVATQFKQGDVPHNKGRRQPGWSRGRMSETWFAKGSRSGAAARNWRPVGTIRVDTEGYLRIKVREAVHGQEATGFGNTKVWPLLQRYTWERERGPIPPGHTVCFRDGDRSHCAIENLELVSREDLARRNSMWNRFPRELAEAIQLNGALKRKMRRLAREKQDDGSAQPPVRNAGDAEG